MNVKNSGSRRNWHVVSVSLFLGILSIGAQVQAQTATVEAGCMQDLAGFDLNCTANDVQIAAASNIVLAPSTCVGGDRDGLGCFDNAACPVSNDCSGPADSPEGDSCAFPGDTVTFKAIFDVVVTAKARYDVGLYFANDGDPNGDGAISGMCSVSTPPFEPEPDFLDLDGTSNDPNGMSQDVCGDIDKPDHNPLNPEITLTTACIDPDGDGKLNLPNCTSWRQSGANELCLSPLDAFPGAPSKCRCDVNFNIDIDVPPAMIEVTKTANPTLINEPGGTVTFTVSVMNDSPFAGVTLESLIDDIHGDLNGQGDCSVPQSIGFGGTYTCMFTANVSGDVGTPETDTITAIGTDENGNMVSDTDDATVDFLDVPPSALLSKTAAAADVTYNVVVTNTSTAESLMVDALVDDVYNDITTANHDGVVSTTCSVPQTIAANGGTYSCSFVATVAAPGVTDTVTGTVSDNEGGEVTPSDSASVSLN